MSHIREAVAAAQAYDLKNRGPGNWSRVPDLQAARLIVGATPVIRAALEPKFEIDAHRWYVILKITQPDGTITEKYIADPDQSGLVIYDNREAYETATQ